MVGRTRVTKTSAHQRVHQNEVGKKIPGQGVEGKKKTPSRASWFSEHRNAAWIAHRAVEPKATTRLVESSTEKGKKL